MTAFKAIYKRELRAYFDTLLAYVFIAIFISVSAFLTFKSGFLESGNANLAPFFEWFPYTLGLLAPAIAMNMWAEEQRSGTMELLFTLPITINQAVLGKFFAGWTFFIIAILLTSPMAFFVSFLGEPDWGPIITGYIGAILIAGGTLAISGFFSSTTKNSVVSFILSVLVCYLFIWADAPAVINSVNSLLPDSFLQFIENLSFRKHYTSMRTGVLEFKDIFFMLAITIGFVYSTNIVLEMKKA